MFRTEAEDELWHLISKSMTYDEAAELWQTIVKNQEDLVNLKAIMKELKVKIPQIKEMIKTMTANSITLSESLEDPDES